MKLDYRENHSIRSLLPLLGSQLGNKNERERIAIADSMYQYIRVRLGLHSAPDVEVGDIIHIDYGFTNYNNEVWYHHIGIVLAVDGMKLMVAPMTSTNVETRDMTRGVVVTTEHGVARDSYVFFNDIKWLCNKRVIAVKGRIPQQEVKRISSEYVQFMMRAGV